MDLQTMIDSMAEKQRNDTMKSSDQITLGELTLLVEQADSKKPVVFDDPDQYPTGLGSWRGSYRELAIRYSDGSGDGLTAGEFSQRLDEADGETFRGYKGGEYTMSNQTPVWVANHGQHNGFDAHYQGVVGVHESDNAVVIETAEVEF